MALRKNSKRSFFTSPLLLFIVDILVLNLSYLLISLIEKKFDFTSLSFEPIYWLVPISIIIFSLLYSAGTVIRIAWDFSGMRDFIRLAFFSVVGVFASCALLFVVCEEHMISGTGILLLACMTLLFCMGIRAFVRHHANLRRIAKRHKKLQAGEGIRNFGPTLIIGAGSGAELLLRDIRNDAFFSKCKPVCAVDDNDDKKGFTVAGITVQGTRHDIPRLCEKYRIKTIFIAIPTISAKSKQELLEICMKTGAETHIMPALSDMLMKNPTEKVIKKVQITDLLGRDPIRIDVNKIMGYVENKTVIVTGGGGSIGSELCRQIASHSPKKLIIFDIYENNAYDVLNEIKRNHPDLDVQAFIGSVRDYARLEQLFLKWSPDIVYHAAAHKHVPLMEDSPNEAIKNNVFGTLNTVRAADRAGVKRFVLISTDKAVNPTNVMGATKRMCEMIVQAYNKKSKTEYVAVRFGNVLGSNGSVIPLFERQIEAGGPVTVTHPDIIRYFMTIPEAASLVLQAGATASGGEIFVLDMGDPVKIDDLARNMIRLSGLEPDVDIEIEYTGLRPGEKLYEELLMDEEGLQCTENKLIHIGHPIEFDEEHFFSRLEDLKVAMADDSADIRSYISELVPTFTTPEKANAVKN